MSSRTILTFLDEHHVEVVQNLTRQQAVPAKHPAPVVGRDRPWESTLYLSGTWSLRRDPDGSFLLWYENWDFDVRRANSATARFAETGGSQRFSSVELSLMQACMAESADGVSWEKPALRPGPAGGTNVVLGDPEFGNVHAFAVTRMPDGADARYRALFVHETAQTAQLAHSLIRSARSDDGRSWTVDESGPTFGSCGQHLGDVVNLSYSPALGEHLLFTRHPEQFHAPAAADEPYPCPATQSSFFPPFRPGARRFMNKRRIWLSRSRDFTQWTEPVEVVVPDLAVDNLDDSFYSLAHIDTGDGHIGFLSVLHEVDNTMDVWLVHSRDLQHWRRLPGAGPLLRRGDADSWDAGLVNVCSPPVADRDEHLIFYGGAPHRHDWWWVGEREGLHVPDASLERGEYALGLARIGLHRWGGLRAGPRPGMLLTRPLPTGAARITVNAVTDPHGTVSVEVIGPDGRPAPGRDHSAAVPITGDDVAHDIRWRGVEESPDAVAVRPGDRLRVVVQDATVYRIDLHPSSAATAETT